MSSKIDYKSSGVDIEKGDLFVERIGRMVKRTYNSKVVSGVGGFCSLYEQDQDHYIAASTDGVGTKLKLAIELNQHSTIGIDLVAMCVNDLICCGAKPQFFLDYFASASLNLETSESVLSGIVEGCLQSEMALIGGETAEMPGVYQPGDYDLAGFSVGQVRKDQVIDGSHVQAGDSLVALSSSGFHSNGYSLVRKIINEVAVKKLSSSELEQLKKQALVPTNIYVKSVLKLLSENSKLIHGMANITGSGFLNIPRMNEKFNYHIHQKMPLSSCMQTICELSGLSDLELHKTFNMGAGFVIATSEPEKLISELKKMNEEAFIIGEVKNDISENGQVYFMGKKIE